MRTETTIIILGTVTLVLMGVLMVYVVSSFDPTLKGLIYKHAFYILVGLCAFLTMMYTDYHLLADRRVYRPIIFFSVIMLILVLIPGIGAKVGEARRWIDLRYIRFQPSEFAKFALILLLSIKLTQKHEHISRFVPGLLIPGVITAFFAGLVFLQHDVGIPFIMGITAFAMMWVAGTRKLTIFVLTALSVPILIAAILLTDFRIARVIATVDPFQVREGIGWQLVQS